ncbi:MAG: ahpC/TSA family protein [Bacillus sp. (in: firmicutes)]|nr:ahpC/TSA family protein [Bacillus sp. (in: firmicutes)]
MVKKVIAAVALVALFAVAMVHAMDKSDQKTTTSQKSGLEEGMKAPDFELKNLAGESVKLSDLKGKKVMVNFWATWCPPCKAEMPEMEKFYQASKDKVEILAINMDPKNDVAGFAKEHGITFPILLDEKDEINKNYQIVSIPTTYFVDEKGIITHKFIGSMKLEDIEQYTK